MTVAPAPEPVQVRDGAEQHLRTSVYALEAIRLALERIEGGGLAGWA